MIFYYNICSIDDMKTWQAAFSLVSHIF